MGRCDCQPGHPPDAAALVRATRSALPPRLTPPRGTPLLMLSARRTWSCGLAAPCCRCHLPSWHSIPRSAFSALPVPPAGRAFELTEEEFERMQEQL